MHSRFFAHNLPMETIVTENGVYCILQLPGSTLIPSAVARFHSAACDGNELIYADHIALFQSGALKRVAKPDWSPDTLLSVNYLEGPIAVQKRLLPNGGEEAYRTPEGRYALLLLLTERARRISHIREALSVCPVEKPCVNTAPIRQALHRRHVRAYVEQGRLPGSFAVRYPIPLNTRVSCIVYGNGSVYLVRRTLESLAIHCCRPRRLSLLVADNGIVETEKERYYAALMQNRAAEIMRAPEAPGLSNAVNLAACKAEGDVLLFLPAGTTLKSQDAVERMLELALLEHVGAVGGVADGHSSSCQIIHNVRAIDTVLMVRKSTFFAGGCFDETFAETGFISAHTLLCGARNLRNVVTPYARYQAPAAHGNAHVSEVNRMRIKDLDGFLKK